MSLRPLVVAIALLWLTACTGEVSSDVRSPFVTIRIEDDGTGPIAVLEGDVSSQLAVRAEWCPHRGECVLEGPPWVNGHLEVPRGSVLTFEGDANVRRSRIGSDEYPEVIDIPSEPLDLDQGPAVLDFPPNEYVITLEVTTPSGRATFFFGVDLV